ncbi:hypothetical protein [Candidatus Sororendozoicomonas aggregata]|uniref:hypothetical protein n=1 Tax=Candidatus Sororendozoicomonas aggregata TaxID=3073239 RepID=UPI002ED49305
MFSQSSNAKTHVTKQHPGVDDAGIITTPTTTTTTTTTTTPTTTTISEQLPDGTTVDCVTHETVVAEGIIEKVSQLHSRYGSALVTVREFNGGESVTVSQDGKPALQGLDLLASVALGT